MTGKKRAIIYSSLAVSVAGMVLTSMIVCKHNYPDLCPLGGFGCSFTGVDGCTKLGESEFSKLFGWISISGIGFFYYSYLSLLFVRLLRTAEKAAKDVYALIVSMVLLGALADVYFGIINFTVIDVPCMLCAYSYIITAVILILTLMSYKDFMGDESMKKIINFPATLGRTITELLIAVALTIVLFIGFTVASGSAASETSEEMNLLPEDEVKGILSHLRSLDRVNVPVAGLTSHEGGTNAYIVINKFADFRCPHCLHASDLLQEAMKRWPGRIVVFYRYFPMDGTCNPMVGRKQEGGYSCNGAQASICASDEKFFPEFYHGVFNFQRTGQNISPDNIKVLTESLGGNWNKMLGCMGSAQTAARLMRDIKDAERLKLDSTPTLMIGDRMLKPGTPNTRYFFQILDALVYEKEGKSAYEEFMKRSK